MWGRHRQNSMARRPCCSPPRWHEADILPPTATEVFLPALVSPTFLPVLLLVAVAAAARAGAAAPPAGGELVAPYVNSPVEDVARLLTLAEVGPGDYLIDLGAGDGRIVIAAARLGALGHGVELDPELVALSRRRAQAAAVADRVAFHQQDIFAADLRDATVVTLYLMPEANLRLRPKLLAELSPGSRVASISFDMGDWEPDARVPGRVSGGLMLWIVPAQLAGRWSVRLDSRKADTDEALELVIEQHFQRLDATLRRGGETLPVTQATLRGRRLSLLAGDQRRRYAFSGELSDGRLTGRVQIRDQHGSRLERWTGRR